jgi:hypothetical protein
MHSILFCMDTNSERGPGRVIGIGGVFFKSAGPERLNTWYAENLGVAGGAEGVLSGGALRTARRSSG